MAKGVFLLIPLAFLTIGLWTLSGTVLIVIRGTEATGVVVDHRVNSDSDGTTYQPVIRFRANSGEDVTFTELVGRGSVPDIGTEVAVLYYEDDPTNAREVSFLGLWVFPLVFTGFGLVFPGLWLIAVLKGRRGQPPPEPSGVADGAAWYRRTETVFEGDELRYVVVGVDDDGVEVRSEVLDTDPSADIIQAGSRIEIVINDAGRSLRF